MKAFLNSQFGYCLFVWMLHNRTLNNKINRIHERALRIVYRDKTSSFNRATRSWNNNPRTVQKQKENVLIRHNSIILAINSKEIQCIFFHLFQDL